MQQQTVTFEGIQAYGRIGRNSPRFLGQAQTAPVVFQVPISMSEATAKQLRERGPNGSVLVRLALADDPERLQVKSPQLHERLAGKVGLTVAAVIAGVAIGAVVFK